MGGPVSPDDAISAIRGTGGAQPGCRALHAKGTLYRGTFIATRDAAELSRAKHLDGSTIPALIRFSNGSGNPKQPDGSPGVRGVAVKFTLPDGSTTDVSTQTARLFVSSKPEGFVDLLKAMRPGSDDAAAHGQILRYAPSTARRVAGGARRQQGAGQLRHHRIPRPARIPLDQRRRQRQIRSLPPDPGRG